MQHCSVSDVNRQAVQQYLLEQWQIAIYIWVETNTACGIVSTHSKHGASMLLCLSIAYHLQRSRYRRCSGESEVRYALVTGGRLPNTRLYENAPKWVCRTEKRVVVRGCCSTAPMGRAIVIFHGFCSSSVGAAVHQKQTGVCHAFARHS